MAVAISNLGVNTAPSVGHNSLNPGQNITVGSVVLVCAEDLATTTAFTGVSDTVGNTYTQIGSFVSPNNSLTNGFLSVWMAYVTHQISTTDVIDYESDPSANCSAVSFNLITGTDLADYNTGAFNSAFGNSANPSVSVTPNFANSLMIGLAATRTFSSITPSWSQASGFSTPPNSGTSTSGGNSASLFGGSKTQASIASVTYNPLPNISTQAWAAFILEIPVAPSVAGATLLFNRQLRY